MKKCLLLHLAAGLLLLAACDRRPGTAVESTYENPVNSLEELEENTTDVKLADEPIPGSEGAQAEEVSSYPGEDDLVTRTGTLLQDAASVGAQEAVSVIEAWQARLEAEGGDLAALTEELTDLKAALSADEVDTGLVSNLMVALGRETTQAAEAAEGDAAQELVRLGGTLTSVGQALQGGDDAEVATEVENEPAAGAGEADD